MVSEHHDTIIALHELAPAESLPEHLEHVCVGVAVMLAHDGFDGLGGPSGVVEGDSATVVVQDVCFDQVVEEEPADKAKFSVDGCSSATSERPLRLCVTWNGHVCVL